MARMEFEWDEGKSDDCFTHCGFDFSYAVRAFLDPNRFVRQGRRCDYGEDRFRLLGAIERRVFVVIYTMCGPAMRIVSTRKANRREVREYEQNARPN